MPVAPPAAGAAAGAGAGGAGAGGGGAGAEGAAGVPDEENDESGLPYSILMRVSKST